jgi:hypothetical protein
VSSLFAALVVVVAFVPALARAQPALSAVGAQLVPTHQALLERRERVIVDKLERLTRALPQVSDVVADVSLPDLSRLALDEPPASVRVSLVVQTRTPLREDVLPSLVRASAPELSSAHLSVTVTRATPAREQAAPLRDVGPFRVAPDSDLKLRTLLGLLLASNVLLASLLLTGRLRRSRRVL